MAKVSLRALNKKKPRPGIHAKNKMSSNKKSKNYKKPYRRQGRV